jgi:hypothetical protein
LEFCFEQSRKSRLEYAYIIRSAKFSWINRVNGSGMSPLRSFIFDLLLLSGSGLRLAEADAQQVRIKLAGVI